MRIVSNRCKLSGANEFWQVVADRKSTDNFGFGGVSLFVIQV